MRLNPVVSGLIASFCGAVSLTNHASAGNGQVTCPVNPYYVARFQDAWGEGAAIRDEMRRRLDLGDIHALYDYQIQVRNASMMAVDCGDVLVLEQIAGAYVSATQPELAPNDPNRVFVARDGDPGRWVCRNPGAPGGCKLDSRSLGKENLLISSQWLSTAAFVLAHTTAYRGDPKYPQLTRMHGLYARIIPATLRRWVYTEKAFSVAGWGCTNRMSYRHHEFVVQKARRLLGGNLSYCNSVTDTDWHLLVTSLYWSRLTEIDAGIYPEPRPGSDRDPDFRSYLVSSLLLLNDRFADIDATTRVRWVFDLDAQRDKIDARWGRYTGEYRSPGQEPQGNFSAGSGDVSHTTRMVMVLRAVRDARGVRADHRIARILDDTRVDTLVRGMATQLRALFNRSVTLNRMVYLDNYWGGEKGWYRLNLNSKTRGHPPRSLTISALTGGYGQWSMASDIPNLPRIFREMIGEVEEFSSGRMASDRERVREFEQYYLTGQYGSVNRGFSKSMLLQIYPSLYGIDAP